MKEKGNITTSKIVNELGLSEPTARKTMREFQALGIATISSVSSYMSSELKLVLNGKFKWFLSEEFQNLKGDGAPVPSTTSINQSNTEFRRMYLPMMTKTLSNAYYYTIQKANDNNCHTRKANSPPEADMKNNNDKINNEYLADNSLSTENKIKLNHNNDDNKKIENYNKQEAETTIINSKDSKLDECSIKDPLNSNKQKNTASLGPENFQRVTVSHGNCHNVMNVVNEMLDLIKTESGSISLGHVLQLACQKSEIVKDYLKGEKLTQRDSRKVSNLFV